MIGVKLVISSLLRLDYSPGRLLMRVLRRNFPGLLLILVLSQLSHAGTFKNPGFISTAYDPIGVASSDFNHDGNTDLVYVDGIATPALHVLLGRGDGTFSDAQDIALSAGSCGYLTCVINLADINQDGITDILLGGSGSKNQLAVMLGNGNGTFQTPVFSSITSSNGQTPSLNAQMGIGDINGDGALDLVIPDFSSASLYILLGDNTGKFTLSSHVTIYFTGHVAAFLADLNGDGKLDAVVNDQVGAQTYVFLGNGDGTFQTQTVYLSFAVSLADMDNDGHPDLVASVYPGQIEVLRGNANGTFSLPIVVTTVATSDFLLAVGDYNGDGILDFVFQNPGGIGIALGTGNLNYGPVISSLAATTSATFFAAGGISSSDFNNDGKNDIAIGVDGGIAVLLGNGDGSFVSGDLYDVGHQVGTVAIADYNGDKKADIAATVAAPYPRLLLGNGQGSFTLAADQNQSYMTQGQSSMLFPGDFNGDGKQDLDILQMNTAYPWGQTFILFGGAGGIFSTPVPLNYGNTVVADFNNDGRSDLITFGSAAFVCLLGQGNGTFTTITTPIKYDESEVGAVGDVNHDGKLDLIVDAYPTLETWLGKGDGTFVYNGAFGTSAYAASVLGSALADFDGDGNPDYIVGSDQTGYGTVQPLTIYYGNGDGTFQSPVSLSVSHNYNLLTVADVNRDNKPDLILTDGNGITVILNMGSRAFDQEQHYVGGAGITGIAAADVNGDGFPDIVAADGSGTTVAVLLNQPNGTGLEGAQSVGVFTVSPNPANYAQPVTLTLTVSAPPNSGLPTPTGSVTFNVDGALITTLTLAAGKASHVYSASLAPGSHTFVATYNGDQTYSASSFSNLLVVQNPVYTTQTALSALPSTVLTSQTVRLTATVTSPVPVQNGIVTFLDGSATLGARTVDVNGVALLDTALLSTGTHAIKAVYQGYESFVGVLQTFTPSTSSAVTVTVSSTVTTTVLTASNNSPTMGTVVTFTANVSSSTGVPFGGVTFSDGGTVLGTSSVQSNGSAAFSTASLSLGSHSVTGTYNANGPFAASTSAAQNISVTAAGGSSAQTVVAMAVTSDDARGRTLLTANLSDFTTAGIITFLDSGNILGSAALKAPGVAILSVPSLSAGNHALTASFAGSPEFAPSVSPDLPEQWPSGGSGFSFSSDAASMTVPTGEVTLHVVPTTGLQQPVSLSCPSGLPAGYTCEFTPDSLSNGGSSRLRVVPARVSIAGSATLELWYALGIFGLSFVGKVRQRRIRILALVLAVGIASACGNPVTQPLGGSMKVVTIQATSASTQGKIVHSLQVILRISPTD